MTKFNTHWPSSYNPGPPEHLHALGVVSMNIGSFEDTLDSMYFEATGLQAIPLAALVCRYYRQDEEKRLREIRDYFSSNQYDVAIVKCIHNLLQYFQWCRDCCNHLLRASLYPPSLGGHAGRIYLVKRINKLSEELGYVNFSLEELRDIADKIRAGVVNCINIRFYLIYRGQPSGKIPVRSPAIRASSIATKT